MKLPPALPILQEEFGSEWENVPKLVKQDMLDALKRGTKLIEMDLRGEDTEASWLHLKAQTVAWATAASHGAEKAWWRALKRYAEVVGGALVAGVKKASGLSI